MTSTSTHYYLDYQQTPDVQTPQVLAWGHCSIDIACLEMLVSIKDTILHNHQSSRILGNHRAPIIHGAPELVNQSTSPHLDRQHVCHILDKQSPKIRRICRFPFQNSRDNIAKKLFHILGIPPCWRRKLSRRFPIKNCSLACEGNSQNVKNRD